MKLGYKCFFQIHSI